MLKDYISRWKRRALERVLTAAVLIPFMLVISLFWNGFDYSDPGSWVVLLVGVVLLVIGIQFVWLLYAEEPSPPTASELRQQLLTVADSVDDLPGGMSLADLCETLDEKQTRKLLHQLHQIRSGDRHLRNVVKSFTATP